MKYRSYNNKFNFFILLIIVFFLFGGIRFFLALSALVFAVLFPILPMIIGGIIVFTILRNSRLSTYTQSKGVHHSRFVELLIHILIHVVEADGRVDDKELSVISSFFRISMQFSTTQLQWVRDLMDHSIKSKPDLDVLCDEFNSFFNYQSKLILLQLVYRVVYSDEILTPSEKRMIDQIVAKLNIRDSDHEKTRALFQSLESSVNHYAILGVKEGVTKVELKKAYRTLCKENHPDKVQHLGDEFRKVAEEKMQKINESYRHLERVIH